MSDWIEFLRDDSTKKAYKTFKQELEDERAYDRRKSLFEKVKEFKESQKPKVTPKEKPKGKRQLAKEAKEIKDKIDKLEDEWLRAREIATDKHRGRDGYLFYNGRIKRELPSKLKIEDLKKKFDDDMGDFYKSYGKDTRDFINYKTGEIQDKYKNTFRTKVPKSLYRGQSMNQA